MFKKALFREYPNVRKLFISLAALGKFVNEKSKQEIYTLKEFATFHWEFRRLATQLAKEKRVRAKSLNRAYEKSIHPELQDKILFYLSDQKTFASKEKHLWSNMSGRELNIFWKVLTTNTKHP